MGSTGRPAKSISEHQKNGTFRADRHGGAVLPVEIPPMPGDLAPTAQAFWNVVGAAAESAGVISRVDGKALRLGADSWAVYLKSQESIDEHGVVVLSETKYGSVLKANPACNIRNAAWKEVMRVLTQFGLTPSSRTSIPHGEIESGDSEESRVMGILKLPGA